MHMTIVQHLFFMLLTPPTSDRHSWKKKLGTKKIIIRSGQGNSIPFLSIIYGWYAATILRSRFFFPHISFAPGTLRCAYVTGCRRSSYYSSVSLQARKVRGGEADECGGIHEFPQRTPAGSEAQRDSLPLRWPCSGAGADSAVRAWQDQGCERFVVERFTVSSKLIYLPLFRRPYSLCSSFKTPLTYL